MLRFLRHISILITLTILVSLGYLGAETMAIYGDTRTNSEIHSQVVLEIAGWKPGIAFHSGDLSQRGQTQAEYDRWKSISAPLSELCRIYPAKGNHERDRELFLANFPYLNGSSWYSLEQDSIKFVVLDSTEDLSPGSPQYQYLALQLAQTGLPIVIIMHHPVFSSGEHGDELSLGLFLPGLFEDSRVKLVISGHEHSYERLEYGGISYLVSGGGGAPLRDAATEHPYSKIFVKKHNYIIAQRDKDELFISVYSLGRELIESITIDLR